MQQKPLRVGFDMDGVLLYNPTRIARPVISTLKSLLGMKNKNGTFYFPKGKLELALWKPIWKLLHMSSLFIAPGFQDIKQLVQDNKIEAYIITARYSFLQNDIEKWLEKLNTDHSFKEWFFNKKDEQPHIFKERLIHDLKLDVFVEDNWDIVKHLSENHSQLKTLWIYNMFDKKIDYPFKFSNLKEVARYLKSLKHP